MGILKINPKEGFENLASKVGNLAKEIEGGIILETGSQNLRHELAMDNDNMFLSVEIPGVRKKDIDIQHEHERFITITGFRKKLENGHLVKSELGSGVFNRRFELPERGDMSGISAELSKGILEITVPRSSRKGGHRVNIS